MKIRDGLVLALGLGFGLTGCASGGGGSAPATGPAGGANILAQGERPRDTENTRAAEQHLGAAEDASTVEEARPHYEQALQSAQAAVTEDPTNPLAHRLAAFAALGVEDYQTAGEHFDRAEELRPIYELEFSPVREQAYIDLYQESSPHLQSGDYTAAAEILENAQAIYPARPEALITLAQIYAQERNHDLALERIDDLMVFFESDQMEDIDPETQAAWQEQAEGMEMLRAQVLVDAGRYEEAVGTYRQIAEEDPTNIVITQDLAAILMQMGNEAEALEVYESLLAQPSLLEAQDYYRIGVGFYQVEDYGRSAEAFGEAAERSRMDRDAIEMWARSLQLDSAYAAVPPVAERWVELDPASQIAITVLAQAVNASGDAARAGEIIRSVDALPVTVDDLQMRRFDGGAEVTGAVSNKTLQQGSTVTLDFTFYNQEGNEIGTQTQQIQVGAPGMSDVFQIEFQSPEPVGGYGYEYTTGS
ncbi:MAG TPA: tetratricopeptide repeat protein [Longimicrobiales bacterium]|nr:tetratricopeptide repeat protein [Longimicrobiales bacterium]